MDTMRDSMSAVKKEEMMVKEKEKASEEGTEVQKESMRGSLWEEAREKKREGSLEVRTEVMWERSRGVALVSVSVQTSVSRWGAQ